MCFVGGKRGWRRLRACFGGRPLFHDPLIFSGPFLFKFFELSFPHHGVKAGTEMARHVFGLAHHLPELVKGARQVLGTNDNNSHRSEERRVGKEGVSTFKSRWSPYH